MGMSYRSGGQTLVERKSKEIHPMTLMHKDPRKEEEPSPEPIDPPTDIPPLDAPQSPAEEPNI
ncbi:hypothetical protein D3C85_1926630 [compost metagenome]